MKIRSIVTLVLVVLVSGGIVAVVTFGAGRSWAEQAFASLPSQTPQVVFVTASPTASPTASNTPEPSATPTEDTEGTVSARLTALAPSQTPSATPTSTLSNEEVVSTGIAGTQTKVAPTLTPSVTPTSTLNATQIAATAYTAGNIAGQTQAAPIPSATLNKEQIVLTVVATMGKASPTPSNTPTNTPSPTASNTPLPTATAVPTPPDGFVQVGTLSWTKNSSPIKLYVDGNAVASASPARIWALGYGEGLLQINPADCTGSIWFPGKDVVKFVKASESSCLMPAEGTYWSKFTLVTDQKDKVVYTLSK